jgi:hypothetical protein
MERWFTEHGAPATATSSPGVHETRSSAWAALFEVQLLSREDEVGRRARSAVDATSEIKNAADRGELASRADESRKQVESFVAAARAEIALEG